MHGLGRLTPDPFREPAFKVRLAAFVDGPPVVDVCLLGRRESIGEIGDQGGDLRFQLAGGAERLAASKRLISGSSALLSSAMNW